MTCSIRATIRAFVAPDHRVSCSLALWRTGLAELGRRGRAERETGAFLLGVEQECSGRSRREVLQFVYYDDLDPHCLDTRIIVFDGAGYSPLWAACRSTGLRVVADEHTHPGIARQSAADRDHPMIAVRGHIAIIVPRFAMTVPPVAELGIYEYLGSHRWHDWSGRKASRFLYIGRG